MGIRSLEESSKTSGDEQGQSTGGGNEVAGVLRDAGRAGGRGEGSDGDSRVGDGQGGRGGEGARARSGGVGVVAGGGGGGRGGREAGGGAGAGGRRAGGLGNLRGQRAGDTVGSGAGNEIHAVGAAPGLALVVTSAVVAGVARVYRLETHMVSLSSFSRSIELLSSIPSFCAFRVRTERTKWRARAGGSSEGGRSEWTYCQ